MTRLTVLFTIFLLTIGCCFAEEASQGHVHCTFTSYAAKRPGEYALRVDDIPTEVADVVSLVGMLEHRTTLNHTNVIAPLNSHTIDTRDPNDVSINHSLQSWLDDGCSANKMVLGVNFVVQTFTLADPKHKELGAPTSGSGKPCPVTNEKGICSYMELCQAFNQSEWIFKWDEEGEVPYAIQGDQWVTYENVLSVHQKVSFAKSQGLGGVSGMNLSYDDYRGKCGERYPLTKAVWNAFRT
ncbi:endochitinase-like [Anopheles coustani]|uniref:endochitinase-like n=1 Tax=Anopheles coustani TaxID=139045 RepID=UPI00265859F2|nr:endochitinase-like [Anopheles coustani]